MPPVAPVNVCLYEDRPHQVAGLKLLLLSLSRYCPNWGVSLRFPGIPSSFRTWLMGFGHVALDESNLPSSGSYNVKPTVLLDGLASGAQICLWLDTDVLVNGSLDFLASTHPDTIVVAQDPWEYPEGSTHRCTSWRLAAGRSLPGPLNSAVVRVTTVHKPLLQQWERLLAGEAYKLEQAKPVQLRNAHMLGDQDALSAVLASREFASIPIRVLHHPTEILQHHGPAAYGLVQRWATIAYGMPPLIHAMGSMKPWSMPDYPSLLRDSENYYERSYLELSPYVHFARSYREAMKESASWLDRQTLISKIGTLVSFNRPSLKGTVQAALHRAWWRLS